MVSLPLRASCKRRRALRHVNREYQLHWSSGQGQQRRAPLVSTILVRLPPLLATHLRRERTGHERGDARDPPSRQSGRLYGSRRHT